MVMEIFNTNFTARTVLVNSGTTIERCIFALSRVADCVPSCEPHLTFLLLVHQLFLVAFALLISPFIGIKRNFMRFGRGIYISSASSSEFNGVFDSILNTHFVPYLSEADSYSDTNMPPRPYHAMILARVVVGLTKKLYDDDTSLTGPPQGYDSVRSVLKHLHLLLKLVSGYRYAIHERIKLPRDCCVSTRGYFTYSCYHLPAIP